MHDRTLLLEALRTGTVELTFVKADGTLRNMTCTLMPSLLPALQTSDKAGKSAPDHVIRVYDLHVAGWRSFKMDSLQNWHRIQNHA